MYTYTEGRVPFTVETCDVTPTQQHDDDDDGRRLPHRQIMEEAGGGGGGGGGGPARQVSVEGSPEIGGYRAKKRSMSTGGPRDKGSRQ